MGKDGEGIWENLEWEKEVQICQQGIAYEDSLLSNYVVLFVAIEAMFFALIFSLDPCIWLTIVIAIFAIYVDIHFMYHAKVRGDNVDRWGTILYTLLNLQENIAGVSASELASPYKGCFDRRGKKWSEVVFGWGTKTEKLKYTLWGSILRFMITLTPIFVILGWIFIFIEKVFL